MKFSNSFTLIYCFIISLLMRFPYFFKDVINWDESTFILTGQSQLDGYLPYTELWDLKPPMLPWAFALFIVLFGKSIISIRVAGAVCVAITAWITYLIGKSVKSSEVGLVAATLTVGSLGSLNFRHFATMSEHVALVPLMGAMLLLVRKPITPSRLFWTGLLLACATMIRLNLAYSTLGIGLMAVLFLDHDDRSFQSLAQTVLVRGFSYTSGVLLIVLLTLLPYLLSNQLMVWWQSVVLAPLSYSESIYSTTQALRVYQISIYDLIFNWQPSFLYNHVTATLIVFGSVLGICIAITLVYLSSNRSQIVRWFAILLLFLITVSHSILNSGQGHLHYLLQVMPFLSLYAAFTYAPLFASNRWKYTFPIAIIALVLMLPHAEYQYISSRIQKGKVLKHGTAYKIANILEESDSDDKSIYMMNSHIVYWLIDKNPLTKASTHPSNISKEYLLQFTNGTGASAESAMLEILEHEPDFIIKEASIGYLENYGSAQYQLEETLTQHYQLIEDVWGTLIYQRNQN